MIANKIVAKCTGTFVYSFTVINSHLINPKLTFNNAGLFCDVTLLMATVEFATLYEQWE